MAKKRYLTKSRFKIGLDCPTKLYYTGKKEYEDTSSGDSFMEALAEGGFQVGELAKLYFPNGHDIHALGYDEALNETNELLTQKNVIIYEAAIKHENLFIRVDVLVKTGDTISFYEVKAKSISEGTEFLDSKGYLKGGYGAYIYDVAFQNFVIKSAFPNMLVKPHLSLMDKDVKATVNGLNQLFRINRIGGRTSVETSQGIQKIDLGAELLRHIDLKEVCERIYEGKHLKDPEGMDAIPFAEKIKMFAGEYEADEKIEMPIGKGCSGCQFYANPMERADGRKSGFHECWSKQTKLSNETLDKPLVFELWKGLMGSRDVISPLLEQKRYFLSEINEQDVLPKSGKKLDPIGLDYTDRRMLQVNYEKDQIDEPYVDRKGFKEEHAEWTYPLHMIDFETSMVAIPFHAGRRPYEQMAFQYSHHSIDKDGRVEHKSQFLHVKKGEFPNYEFVRALKKDLEQDEGTIFRYHNHENTVLNQIKGQLNASTEPDKEELIEFIETITHGDGYEGYRDMVDMYKLVLRYFYHRSMKGSNSIKAVLPAILACSPEIRNKYGQPIYGTEDMPSLNFSSKTWLEEDENGKVVSPYKLLPSVFEDLDDEQLEANLSDQEQIAGGGEAMMAWAQMQFTEMSEQEHDLMANALLKYCELDTLAMVMILEFLKKGV